MATVEASIQAALFARAASLVLSPVHPVAWPNVAFTAPANKKYLRVTHFPNTTERTYIGSNEPHMHQGILQITVIAPLNSGESAARELAGVVADHFPCDLPLFAGVRVERRATVGSKITTDTEIQIPVSIRYRGEA